MLRPYLPDGLDLAALHLRNGTHPDAVITAFGARQHHAVDVRQLLLAGLTRDHVRGRARSRHLVALGDGMYLIGHATPSPVTRRMVGVLRGRDGTVLGGLTAAAHLGAEIREPARVSVIVPPGRRIRRPDLTVRDADVPAHEQTVSDGVPCLTWPRLLLDLAAHHPRVLRSVWHQAIYRGQLHEPGIARVLDEHPREPGTRALQALWDRRQDAIGASANAFEDDLRDIVVAAGLPEPRRNVRLTIDGVTLRPDLHIPERGLALEGDGRDNHDDPEQQLTDSGRDRLYRRAGLTELRIAWWAVNYQHAGLLADFVRFEAAWQRTGGRWTAADPLPRFAYARLRRP